MVTPSIPFIPSSPPQDILPLSHFIPPYGAGVAAQWLKKSTSPGSWIIDPFGTSPLVDLEMARAGHRVLVSINNPVTSFVLRVLAKAPGAADFQSALAGFSMLRCGDERLESHLQSLYQTRCVNCTRLIPAQAFVWKRNERRPFARLYQCQNCGDEGERPISDDDFKRLTIPGNDSLHRSRAIELLKLKETDELAGAAAAINTYLPRSLYFIMTFLRKLDNTSIPEQHRQLLQAQLLSACSEGASLWGWPSSRSRPRQLQIPAQFRENNLWLAIENSIPSWSRQANNVALTEWPDFPPAEGGICLYQGRLKNILPLPSQIRSEASVTIFPRPNQAFWTLSALWAGWLWGHESIMNMKSVFGRRRYDWSWHVNALQSNLHSLSNALPPGFPLFCLLSELEPGLLLSSLIAADRSNFTLAGIALRPEQETAQLLLQAKHSNPPIPARLIGEALPEVIRHHFSLTHEPAEYLSLLAACMGHLSSNFSLAAIPQETAEGEYRRVQAAVIRVLTERGFLVRYHNQSLDIESGLWYLEENRPDPFSPTLADRVEEKVLATLQESSFITYQELDQQLCEIFPGLIAPSSDLILACLESYAEVGKQSVWLLRPSEKPEIRHDDLQSARVLLAQIGSRFGFNVQGENPLIWTRGTGEEELFFYLSASCHISRLLFNPSPPPPNKCVLVLPGSRSKLLAFKLHRDPHLAQFADKGWRFLKFRLLRQLAERPQMTLHLWNELLDTDPPLWEEAVQIALL